MTPTELWLLVLLMLFGGAYFSPKLKDLVYGAQAVLGFTFLSTMFGLVLMACIVTGRAAGMR